MFLTVFINQYNEFETSTQAKALRSLRANNKEIAICKCCDDASYHC